MLTLAAAALYAVYTVLLKVMMTEDSENDMMAFFGYLGATNAVVFAPVLLIMQLAGSFNVFTIGRATLSVALLKGVIRWHALHLHSLFQDNLTPCVVYSLREWGFIWHSYLQFLAEG